jgi:hypothetical protein
MNWDAIGAIAELLGAIGVIASLVYLATQIRESHEQMRAATYQQLQQQIAESMNWQSHSPEIEQATRLGIANFKQLSEEDAHRFFVWAGGVLMACENAYYQYRIGMLDDDRWRVQRSIVQGMFSAPGVAQWWRSSARRPRGRRGDRGLRPAACLESPSSSDSDCADADVRRSPSLRASTDQKRKR